MALPIILNAPTYDVELPLSKKTVTYRPYLVKEEKILMMALESQDQKQIMKTVQDIINACTFGKIKAKDLPTAELELLFLKLRSKSVGETSEVSYECKECKTPNPVTINLVEIEITTPEKTVSPRIMLTDTVGVVLKYPTADDVTKALNSKDAGTDVSKTFAIITACVEAIFDGENTHEAASLEKKDVEDFIDSLSTHQFKKIQEFFESIPKLSKDISFTCSKCGAKNDMVLEGLQSFFG